MSGRTLLVAAFGVAWCSLASLMLTADLASAQAPKSSWSGVYSEAQATRGASIYVDSCAGCHAPGMTGGPLAPSLTGVPFFSRWNGKPMADLFDYVRSSMPLNSPGGLGAQQTAAVLAFMLRQGSFPAGTADLPADAAVLKQIQLLAARP